MQFITDLIANQNLYTLIVSGWAFLKAITIITPTKIDNKAYDFVSNIVNRLAGNVLFAKNKDDA